MPYSIIQIKKKPARYSVINKITHHNFSPKGISKAMAKRQLRALYLHTRKMEGGCMSCIKNTCGCFMGKDTCRGTPHDPRTAGLLKGGVEGAEPLVGGLNGNAPIYDAMSDDDLRKYFPNAKVVKYSEIPKGVGAEDWLTKAGDVVYILYEAELNTGHWVAIARAKDAIYYFDSYGNKPDVPLNWTSEELRKVLGQDVPVLTKMFSITKLPVYYNDFDYQTKKDMNVATCGRWATAFLTHFKKYGGDLKSFKRETVKRAKAVGKPLDKFIANIYDE